MCVQGKDHGVQIEMMIDDYRSSYNIAESIRFITVGSHYYDLGV